jgi:predicted nuclease of predicted toxin-antitoxin system
MKLLLDQNLSFKLCQRLSDIFPGCGQVRMLGLAERDDKAIWEHAKEHGFVIVSQDADFAELAGLYGPPPKVIWLRCGNQETDFIEALLRRHAVRIAEFETDSNTGCLEIY